MKTPRTHIFCILALSLFCLTSAGQAPGQQQSRKEIISSAIRTVAGDPALAQGVVSICIRTADGVTVAEHRSGTLSVPASNMKLLSTGVALHVLGGDYRYETEIGYSGRIEDGILKGDLYIIGGGDPTLGSKDSIAVSIDRTFGQWERLLTDAGIRKIEGRIIGDGRWAEGMAEEPTWSWQDVGVYYGTGVTGLMFYENMLSFTATAGSGLGAPVSIEQSYPLTPWMSIRNEATTGKQGTGDETYMYTSEFAPVAAIRGTFAIDRKTKRVDFSNKFPEYTCARYFEDRLRKRGIGCSLGAADFRLKTDWISEGSDSTEITILGKTQSPALRRIAFSTNHVSNNLYAETLMKTIGLEIAGSTAYEASATAMTQALEKMGVSTTKGVHIQDGSGLSRQNYVSADFLCRFLKAMMSSPAYKDFLNSLPSPGFNGSLQFNMKSYPEDLRKRIKVKSGSMNGVRCYSGYILPSTEGGETLIISILTSNSTAPTWKTRQLLDKLMATIAQTN